MAKFNSNDAGDLLGIARLAQTNKFRPVIGGCVEGWIVAEELGRAGAYAIITPRTRLDRTENLAHETGSSIENAAILHKAGVQVAVVPANTSIDMGGTSGRDLLHLPIEAGFAVRGGLSDKAALEAITIVPARLLGIDHRVGTLEVGKDADLVLTDGDILHYQTFVQYTVVGGEQVYDKEEEVFYAHIRPRAEVAVDAGEEVAQKAPAAEDAE
jgi:imidazolonepropionase-like amidohydrolase